ncbi:MAG: hypothetical protein ACK50B_15695 [Betaproteobacteria bacterium]|jgi:hypothetical protein
MKQEISQRFARNIARVKNLVAIYRTQLAGPGQGRRSHQETDVLRAAAVLLHASLEDVLRSLAYWKLPGAQAAVLDQIPIVGGTAIKVSLGTLSAHRGKTIDQLIKASTDASLERSNYNNPSEVSALLQSVGLSTAPLAPYMAILEDAMQRRHRIVHRADENPNAGRGNHRVASISPQTLDAWIANTEGFVRDVLAQATSVQLPPNISLKRTNQSLRD